MDLFKFSGKYRKLPLEEKFHVNYVKLDNGCWEWKSSFHTTGYGIVNHNKKAHLAHILSWNIHNGNPEGLCVLHRCDNRKCVNPEHLFLGTRKENNRDRDDKNRKAVGKQHGQYIHGKFVNQIRWRTRPDGSRYFFNGNSEKVG